MFPNDDICNVDAARGAANRLFRRYKNTENKDQPVLGKSQVNRLMKAAYDAINMPYDPNQEDVFSFMDIFDSNKDGQIQLQDLEAMAVKYLCGEQALTQLVQKQKPEVKPPRTQQIEKDQQSNKKIQQSEQKITPNLRDLMKQWKQPQIQFKNHKLDKQPQLQSKSPIQNQYNRTSNPYRTKAYTPNITPKTLSPQISTKNSYLYRDSGVSTNESTMGMKNEAVKQKLSLQQIFEKGKQLFNSCCNPISKGITETQARKLMGLTDELLGKKRFAPSKEDGVMWIRLCDRNKDGVVDLQDYKYFLQRTYEREQRYSKA